MDYFDLYTGSLLIRGYVEITNVFNRFTGNGKNREIDCIFANVRKVSRRELKLKRNTIVQKVRIMLILRSRARLLIVLTLTKYSKRLDDNNNIIVLRV